MKLSWAQIGGFFAVLLLLGGLLYPRAIFLGMIYEGTDDLITAEQFYLQYLSAHPYDRFVTLRLADLYGRMALPDQATPLLRNLVRFRRRDWSVAQRYLDHLERRHHAIELLAARIDIAHQFRAIRGVDQRKCLELLEGALQQALWLQLDELADALLQEMAALQPDNSMVREWQFQRALGQHDADRIIADLSDQLTHTPGNDATRAQLLEVYAALGRWDEVLEIASRGLLADAGNGELLTRRAMAHEQLGHTVEAIADYELAQQTNPNQELPGLPERLLTLYQRTGQLDRALRTIEQRITEDPERQEHWVLALNLLDQAHDGRRRAMWLNRYLQQFPDDQERLTELNHVLLYQLQDASALPTYRRYVQSKSDGAFALDVGEMLLARQHATAAVAWLTALRPLFPRLAGLVPLLIRAELADHNIPAAVALLAALPASPARDRQLAPLYEQLGDWQAALAVYRRMGPEVLGATTYWSTMLTLSKKTGQLAMFSSALAAWAQTIPAADAEHWLVVSQLLAASHGCRAALAWLTPRQQTRPTLPITYTLHQCLLATGHRSAAFAAAKAAQKTADIFSPAAASSAVATRMQLHLMAGPRWNRATERAYQSALARYPQAWELQVEYLDQLLDHGEAKRARTALARLQHNVSAAHDEVQRLEARLALLSHRCLPALPLWEQLARHSPDDTGTVQGYAECLLQAHQLRAALALYDQLARRPEASADLAARALDLHRQWDSRVETSFAYTDLHDDAWWSLAADYRSSPLHPWQYRAHGQTNRYQADSMGVPQQLTSGLATVTYAGWHPWQLTAGVWGGGTATRSAVSPVLAITGHWHDRHQVQLHYTHRTLRDDLARAVLAGSVQQRVAASTTHRLGRRVQTALAYQFTHDTSAAGNRADTHLFQPAIDFILHEGPDLTVGYQFEWSDTTSPDAYLTEVPLIPRVRAHYLTLQAAARPRPTVQLTAGGYLGADISRDLRFTRGDLFGIQAGVRWDIRPHWLVSAQYQVGRSRTQETATLSHQTVLGVTTHW